MSLRMIIVLLVLFLSDVCVHLNAASNQSLLMEDDDCDQIFETSLVSFSGKWIEIPEDIRNRFLSISCGEI